MRDWLQKVARFLVQCSDKIIQPNDNVSIKSYLSFKIFTISKEEIILLIILKIFYQFTVCGMRNFL